MLAAKLRHRVTLQSVTITRDAHGGVIETWGTYQANVPAEIVPLSGREFIASAAMQAAVDTRIAVRWIDGLTPGMRVKHGDLIYNIQTVLPDPSLRRHLTLMCQSGVER